MNGEKIKLCAGAAMGEERNVYRVLMGKARRKETTWKTKA
jgi:hypothetical protein